MNKNALSLFLPSDQQHKPSDLFDAKDSCWKQEKPEKVGLIASLHQLSLHKAVYDLLGKNR